MSGILSEPEMGRLVTLVEEAARSTEEGVKHFIEPAPGTLQRTTSRRHHIVFGRRGSGKSSLLRKAAADLTIDRRPIAYVNLEAFKGHSYPDVLISVLITTLQEFKRWFETAAVHPSTKTSFWQKLFGTSPKRKPFSRSNAAAESATLGKMIADLTDALHSVDDAEIRAATSSQSKNGTTQEAATKLGSPIGRVTANVGYSDEVLNRQETEELTRRSKVDHLHRNILEYQTLFRRIGELSGGDAYLFIDDLYHIRRTDQAKVIDYFHRIAKDHRLWLKIGTIRHRTRWYLPGDPPTGLKLGDDADEIDLDLTLEKYGLAKEFLEKVLSTFSNAAGSGDLDRFLTPGAIDRLVLASGGVARDFLSIFRRSVDIARERAGGPRGDKVGAEDVNAAAGEHDATKREEFKLDTSDDTSPLENVFDAVKAFCLERNNTNCFLLEKDAHSASVELIRELVDLKLIHLVRSRVTVSGRPGQHFEAYMLDLSQYAGARKRRELEMVQFWKRDSKKESLRKISLIYDP